MAIIEALAVEGAATGISKLIEAGTEWYKVRRGFLGCSLTRRNQEARVVRSAIVSITTPEGLYPLVKNLHRPETLAPFGGVYKYLAAGEDFLSGVEFIPHYLGGPDDSECDLRGFLKRKRIGQFHRWSQKGMGRESETDCIQRELSEELSEVGIKLRVPPLRLKHIRTIRELPRFHEEVGYTQFRVFDVAQLDTNHVASKKFVRDLVLKSRKRFGEHHQPDIELVTPAEIREGRSRSGRIIAHHANYFFGASQGGPFSPLFPRNMRPQIGLTLGSP